VSDPRDDLDDEGDAPQPWWRQRKIIAVGIGIIALVAFIMTRGPQQKTPDQGLHQAGIGQVVAYKAEAAPAPPPPAPKPPSFGPPRTNNPPSQQEATWPAMVTYAVPPRDKPTTEKPKDDPQTTVAFKTSTIPGLKSGPALDLTYVLLPGLIFCELDVAIDSSIPGPLQCHLPGPVYSQTGILLMEAGTHIYGNYQSME
jgi:type IV secretory pathway VirB10-like protein